MPSSSAPLRVGLLIATDRLPRYLATAIDEARSVGLAEIVVIARDVSAPGGASSGVGWYARWDGRHRDGEQHPLHAVPIDRCVPVGTPRHDVVSRRTPDGRAIDDTDVTPLVSAGLDVIVCLGLIDVRGAVLDAARYGCWWCRPDPVDEPDAMLGGLIDRRALAHLGLLAAGGEAGGGVWLERGAFAAAPGLSQAENQRQPYWLAAQWLVRLFDRVRRGEWSTLLARARPAPATDGPSSPRPSNLSTAGWFARTVALKSARRLTRRPKVSFWSLAISAKPPGLIGPGAPADLSSFVFVQAPPGHFYADPFLFRRGGSRWLFFEDYDFATRRGTIACAALDEQGRLGPARTVLDRPFHLSYPCVFEHEGEVYMVPESKANGTVDLYRCRRFPGEWELARTLFDGPVVDTTVVWHDARFWFFATLLDPRGGAGELWLFTAPALHHPWAPHPMSPISSDVRTCRGAGAIVHAGGRLYRPCQDGSRAYGGSLAINEIVTMDAQRYAEREVRRVEPTWRRGLVGTHSYAALDGLEVIDACELVPRRAPARTGPSSRAERADVSAGAA